MPVKTQTCVTAASFTMHVKRVKDTIFMALPRELWLEIDGGCACPYCSDNGKSQSPAYWDTLAVTATKPAKGNDFSWTVHYPELHGARPKRSTA